MKDKALAAIAQHRMLQGGGRVVVGVSGGADSVALLHFLWACSGELGITVLAAHVNHGLRGAESDRDEQFVSDLCARLNIPLRITTLQGLDKQAKAAGQGLEAHARNARYRFFEELAQELHAKIATAHTMDDSIETTLFNLARGTGLRGLRGIPPVRGAVVRPLIRCTRCQIEAYCAQNGLDYVTDSTNLTDQYARNRIRWHVVPQLRLAHNGFDTAYARMTEHLALDEDFLQQAARQAFAQCACNDEAGVARNCVRHTLQVTGQAVPGFSAGVARALTCKALGALHGAVQYRVLALWLEQCGLPCSTAKVQLILAHLGDTHFAVELMAGRYVQIADGVLALRERVLPTPYFELQVKEGTFAANTGIAVTFALTNYEQYKQIEKFDTKGLKNALDYDKIYGNLMFRQKRDGDKIKLGKTGMTKSLKKLFNEAKLSAWQRQNTPVLADEGGVVWVSGFGADERAMVTEHTNKILTVSMVEVGKWNKTF